MWILQQIDKRPDEAIQQSIEDTVKIAKEKWTLEFQGEYPTNGIGITTLRPFHVESATLPNPTQINVWRVAIAAAQTWQDWVNAEINKNLFVIIAGLFNWTPSPSLSEIAFTANGTDLPVNNIESLYASESGHGWFSKPFVVTPENMLIAYIYGNVAQTELLGMLGFAIARRTLLIKQT